jgi:hypothetical protein
MNRRDFFKAIGGIAALAAMPDIPVLNAYPLFDPTKRYGDGVLTADWIGSNQEGVEG